MNQNNELQTEGFLFLRDQEPLSDDELQIARKVRQWVEQTLRNRETLNINSHGDPGVWWPASNWNLNQKFYQRHQALLRDKNIPLLRMYAAHFTGYPLYSLGTPCESILPNENIRELDEFFKNYETTPDRYVATYLQHIQRLPVYLHISPPRKFGEVGWKWEGGIINYDTCAFLERLAILHNIGLLDEHSEFSLLSRPNLRILEIGGGYGGLAYYLKGLLKNCRYVIVDLPESLLFSATYLSVLYKTETNRYGLDPTSEYTNFENSADNPGFTFVPNYEFPSLIENRKGFDLCINTLSMSEMTEEQVRTYCRGIKTLIGSEGYFFEQNQDNRPVGFINAQDIIRDYFPYHQSIPNIQERYPVTGGYANIWSNRPLPSFFGEG